MEVDDLRVIQLELKYCERCGGLWLREQGSSMVYCIGCAAQFSGFASSRKALPRVCLPPSDDAHSEGDRESQLFWDRGGNA